MLGCGINCPVAEVQVGLVIVLYSFKLLFVKAKSGLVLSNTWVSYIQRESKEVPEVVLRILVKLGVADQNTFFVIKF